MPAFSEEESHPHFAQLLLQSWPLILASFLGFHLARAYFHHGLNRYPGPFLAKFTNAWRLWDVRQGDHHHTMIKLHEKYGSVVRTSPNTIILSDVEYVPKIYGIKKGFIKSKAYHAFSTFTGKTKTFSMFAIRDEQIHTEMKRPVAGMYALSALQENEPLVDEMICLFMDRLEEEFDGPRNKGRPCDIAAWLQYYAFDVILNITFGNTMGFMALGGDAGNFIKQLEANGKRTSQCSQMLWLAYFYHHNPLRGVFQREATSFPGFVRQQMAEHAAKLRSEHATLEAGEKAPSTREDMLTRFMRIPGGKYTMPYALANVFAGSDTTAITLRAILYFLLKHPRTLRILKEELRSADPPLSYPVTWKESQRLPYLHAVIEESLRLHPAVGFSLERDVPEGGLEMPDGYNLPAGTTVGINAWVTNRQSEAFGPLPTHDFIPERWLRASDETQEAFDERLSTMRRYSMSFGWGKRICLGRNISYLEIYKVIPTLVLEFDIALANPDKEWTVSNDFFVKQSDMDCILRRRADRGKTMETKS